MSTAGDRVQRQEQEPILFQKWEVHVTSRLAEATTVEQIRAVYTVFNTRLEPTGKRKERLNRLVRGRLIGLIDKCQLPLQNVQAQIEERKERLQAERELHLARKEAAAAVHFREKLAEDAVTKFESFVAEKKTFYAEQIQSKATVQKDCIARIQFQIAGSEDLLMRMSDGFEDEWKRKLQDALTKVRLESDRFSLRMRGMVMLLNRLEDRIGETRQTDAEVDEQLKKTLISCKVFENEIIKNGDKLTEYEKKLVASRDEFDGLNLKIRQTGNEAESLDVRSSQVEEEKGELETQNDELLAAFDAALLSLEQANRDKEDLKALLQPHQAALEALRNNEKHGSNEDLRKDILATGAQLSSMVGHSNQRQGLMQAKQYVTSNQELREENIALEQDIKVLRRDIQQAKTGTQSEVNCGG